MKNSHQLQIAELKKRFEKEIVKLQSEMERKHAAATTSIDRDPCEQCHKLTRMKQALQDELEVRFGYQQISSLFFFDFTVYTLYKCRI
jgi:nitrate/TMAO reductase-like tetraheme cytochrome c subunit